MKKFISALALTALIVPAANATTARLLALGMNETDNEGMFFIEDNRNIFLNSATVNDFSNSVIIEMGDNGATVLTNAQTDTDHKPKAKGGILQKVGNYTYGVFMGHESNTSSMLRIISAQSQASKIPASDNQLDLFVGGGSDLKWGANLVYTKDENKGDQTEDSGIATRFGLKTDKWSALINLSLKSEAEDKANGDKFDGKLGVQVGGSYSLSGTDTVYAYAKKFDWEQKNGTSMIDGGFLSYSAGYAHKMMIEEGFLFANVEYRSKEIEVKYSSKAEANNKSIPVSFGFEKKALSWLTLRGSVTQNIWGTMKNKNYSSIQTTSGRLTAGSVFGANTDGKTATMPNTTDVRAGASLNFGNLDVDGLIGATNSGTAITEKGELRLDQLLYRVGMTYKF